MKILIIIEFMFVSLLLLILFLLQYKVMYRVLGFLAWFPASVRNSEIGYLKYFCFKKIFASNSKTTLPRNISSLDCL